MDESRSQGFWTALLVSSFLWSTLLLLAPGNLYLPNIDEFTLRPRDLLAFSLPLFCAAALGTSWLLTLAKPALRRRLVSFLLALAALLWFQGNILVWDYGLLDGKQIEWDEHWRNGVIDTPIWVLVLLGSLLRPEPFYRVARVASAALLVLPLVAMFASAAPSGGGESHGLRDFAIDQSAKFVFSKEKNAILIVMDEFQSNVFQEIVEEEEYASIFEGFTYFRDTVAGAGYTELAIPALLTGRLFDNKEPRDRFLERVYLDDSVMAVLKRAGYVVDIYPWVGWANASIFFDERVASNLRRLEAAGGGSPYTEAKAKEVLHLIDLSLFRSAPHFLKRHIYNEQLWFLVRLTAKYMPRWVKETVSTDRNFEANTFGAQAARGIEVTRGEPTFKYYHVKGAHTPLTVNQDLEFTGQTFPYSRSNYTAQAKASLRSMGLLFEELKRNGVFEQSLIVVAGDHGSGGSEEMFFGTSLDSDVVAEGRRLGTGRGFRRDKARGIPILLVKRSGAAGPLTTSDAPASLLDVPATVFSELGIEASPTGTSLFELGPGTARTRRYGAFDFHHTKGDYVGPIVVYTIDGDSWQDDSWGIEGIYPPPTNE